MRHQIFSSFRSIRSCVLITLTILTFALQTGCASTQRGGINTVTGEADNLDIIPISQQTEPETSDTDAIPSSAGEEVASLGNPMPGTVPAPLVERLELRICPTDVSNQPINVNGRVSRKSAIGCFNGMPLLVAPSPGACMTSGFGVRNGKNHSGVDYQSRPAGNIVAAGSGKVIFRGERKRFGNWVLIDHGSDVFTAYAHMASFEPNIRTGVEVKQGQFLGVMGDTGDYIYAIHLHYEIRHGKLDREGDIAENYFFLEPINPFSLPESCPAS